MRDGVLFLRTSQEWNQQVDTCVGTHSRNLCDALAVTTSTQHSSLHPNNMTYRP